MFILCRNVAGFCGRSDRKQAETMRNGTAENARMEASEQACALFRSINIAESATINELCCCMSNIVKMTVYEI